jgi:hypothetical protein
VVISSLLQNQSVTLYATKDWAITRQFPIASSVTAIALSPDEKTLAIGLVDGAIELYD